MATPNPIKIIEVTQVSPSSTSPNSATDFTLPLTLFDTFWFKFHPVERLFFYQFTDSTTPTFFFYSTTLPKLKHSLSLTLLHFLPLAGHLKWPSHAPKPTILYTPNDGGVPFTVAESNADFNHLSSNETLEAVELHRYIPNLPISDDIASIIALQITLFPNLGFCIGITAHHAILDGKTATMFIKAWAHICKQDQEKPSFLPEEQTPFFDRTVIKDPNGLDMMYLNNWLDMEAKLHPDSNPRNLKLLPFGANIEGLVRATFELSREDIKKLRERVLSMLNKVDEEEKKASKSIHLSSFVLTLAYVLVCMVKAKGLESTRKVQFGFTADYRTRLDPPVPVNYFGNCVGVYDMVVLEARAIMEENGITILAEKISDVIRGMENKGVLEGAEEKLAKWMTMDRGALMIGVAGSPRFEVYRADFGWGRPKKVEIVSIDRTGAISLAESRDGSGGIEAGLVMKKHEMEAFSSLFVDGLKCR